MAEFRSYAREGQLGRPIQTPDKATADYKRGKQFVGKLKEEKQSAWERDQKFLGAYKEKLVKEKNARIAVENAKRESIEAERKQRVANANLKADFAEKEAKVNNARIQTLAGLVPSIAKDVKTAFDKRKEFDKEQALNAIHATGLTPQQIQEEINKQYTSDEWATNVHANLLKMKEAGINHGQYNQFAISDSIYGTSRLKFAYQEASGNFPLFLAKMMGETLDDGTLVTDAFNSTTLPNNKRKVYGQQLIKKFEELNGISNLTQSFRKELDPRGNLETLYNGMYQKLASKQEAQAHEAFVINETESVVGLIRSNKLQQELKLIATEQGTLAAHLHLKRISPFIIKALGDGRLDEYYSDILNLKSYDQHGKLVIRAELNNQFQVAIDKRRGVLLGQARLDINARNVKHTQLINEIEDSMLGLTPQEQQQLIEEKIGDHNLPFAVISQLHSYSERLHSHNRDKSIQAEKFVQEDYERTGVPLSIQELKERGLTGSQLTKWAEIYTKWQKSGDKPLFDGFQSEMIGKYRALVKSQPLSDHPYQKRIINALMNDYSRSYNANRAHMSQTQADEIARKYVQDRWDDGTADPDEKKRTGIYRFVDGDTPMDATFPEFDSSRGSTQPKVRSVAQAFDKHGSNFVNIPNSLWSDDTLNVIELTTHSRQVPSHVIQHAQDALAVTPAKDTWQGVLRAQMEASKIKPPAWLIEQTDAQKELFNQTSDRPKLRNVVEHAHKPGESPEVTREKARRAAGVEQTNFSQGAFNPVRFTSSSWKDQTGEPGADFVPTTGNQNIAILPGIIKELKHSYNPNRIGGDGRMGAGWGHYVIVEHVDPNNGQRFEALYAHFPKSDWQKLKVGQRLQQFQPFGRMGWETEYGGPDKRSDIGSTTNYHMSVDFYNVGSHAAYPYRQGIINYVRNLGRGNQAQKTNQQQLPPGRWY